MPTELVLAPGAVGLPTIDPLGLVMLSAVRFAGAECEIRPVAGAKPLLVVRDSPANTTVTCDTAEAALALLVRNKRGLDSSLSDSLRGDAAAVEAVARAFLFPAFQFLLHSDAALRSAAVGSASLSSSWIRRVASSWALRGGGSGGALQFKNVAAALELAEKGLNALDRMLSARGARISDSSTFTAATAANSMYVDRGFAAEAVGGGGAPVQVFILGTPYPTSGDCFAFAAATLFLHGDFYGGGNCRDTTLLKWQARARSQFPLLLGYAERIRRAYFEDLSGTYGLKAIPALDDAVVESAVYREGRLWTVLATASFSFVYFVVVNAGVILQLLGGGDNYDEPQQGGGSGADGVEAPPPQLDSKHT
jgi:hypothetical protein